jgi:hypothetical protein
VIGLLFLDSAWGDKINGDEIDSVCRTRGRGEKYINNILVENHKCKRLLGRCWRRWEDNIKMDLG